MGARDFSRELPSLGHRVDEARRASGLTQAALAEAIGIDRTAISKIESGSRKLSSTELARIARVLDRPVEWFVTSSPSEKDLLRALRRKRAAILRVARKHGGRSVRIFGSVVRAEAGPESDIDLLVEMEPGRGLLEQAAMLLELEDLLGRDVDIVTPEGLRDRVRDRVLREAVPL
jgi:uncharacterized protein